MVSTAVSRTLRYLAGIEDPEPEEPGLLDNLGQGIQDFGASVSSAAGAAGTALGQGIRGVGESIGSAASAVSDAYAVPPEERPPQYSGPSYAQPSLAPGQPSMLEQLPDVATGAGRGLTEGLAAAPGVADRALMGPKLSAPTWEDPLAPVREVGQHVAAHPGSVLPLSIYSEVQQAATDPIGRRAVEAAGGGTDPLFRATIPESVPLVGGAEIAPSAQDIGGFAASATLDPLNFVGAAGAGLAGRGVRHVAAEAARGLPVIGESEALLRGGAGLVRRGLGAASDALSSNAARTAAADARMAAEGSTAAPGVFGVSGLTPNTPEVQGLRPRIIPPGVADELDFPIRLPEDPSVLRAIEAAGGSVDERGTTLNVIRQQDPEAAGGAATRSMTFYTAGPPGAPSEYARTGTVGPQGVGGQQRIEGPTRFRNPLFISDAPGEAAGFDDAMQQMGLLTHENDNWRGLPMANAGPSAAEVERGIAAAKRAGPAGSAERAEALKTLVTRYGGDPDVIDDLIALRGAEMGESVYAVKENIVAGNARRAGHDGVITIQPQRAPYEEVQAHPSVKAAMAANTAAWEEQEAAQQAARAWREQNPIRGVLEPQPSYEEEFRVMQRVSAAQRKVQDTGAAVREAEEAARAELSGSKITELADPREARNPTPGTPTAELKAAYRRLKDAEDRHRELSGQPLPIRADELAEAQQIRAAAQREAQEANDALDALMNEADVPTGYTLRPDIPRRVQSFADLEQAYKTLQQRAATSATAAEGEALLAEMKRMEPRLMEALQRERGTTTQASAGAIAAPRGPGALPAVNRALSEGLAGGVGGAVIEQGRNPDEDPRTAAARGFAAGAVGFPLATRAARGAARLAGAAPSPGGGALATLGGSPERASRFPGMGEELIPELQRPGRPTDPATRRAIPSQPIGDALPDIIRQLNAPPAAPATEGASLPLVPASPGRARQAANTAARLLSSGLNKVQTARIAGMLSDTAGQIANVAGGPVLQAIDITTGPIAAALDVGRVTAQRAVGKQAARAVFFSETGERLKGMARGGSIGIGRAVDVMRGGLDAGEAAKLEQRGGFGTNIRGVAPAGSRAAGAVDVAMEAPLRALGAADAVFKTSAQGGHLMAEAYAAARKANGGRSPSPEQIRQAAQRPEVLERVQYLSSRSVLQEDRMLTNWYKRAMNYRSDDPVEQATADLLKAGLAVEIPFVRTPYNVVAQGMGMTPAGLLGVVQDVKQGKAAREVEQRLARVMLGTAIMAPVAAGVAEGRFTGPYPDTEKERSMLPPGWRPWSAKVDAPNGETYYLPLSYAQGLAMPIVMGLLAREASKKDGWSIEAAGKVAVGVGEYAAQETFLEGFGAIGKLFDSKASPATWQREAEQIASSYAPFSGLGREMQRVMGMPARDPEGPVEAVLATYPLTAGQVEPRQDVLGREASLGVGGPAGAVVRAGVENDTGVLRAFRRAGEGLPMQAPDSIPDPDTGRPRPLSEHQQHRWRRIFGSELRQGWANAGAPSDAESLRKIEAGARSAANDTMLGRR